MDQPQKASKAPTAATAGDSSGGSDRMQDVISLCKRRGFLFPSSELYGGLNACWDYGPLGVEFKNNVKQAWWHAMVRQRDDVVGLDAAILMARRRQRALVAAIRADVQAAVLLQHVVGAEAMLAVGAVHHGVGEDLFMAGCLPDAAGHQDAGI